MRLYRRLLQFLRPHSSRMAGNVLSNVIGAILDAVAFSLLIPFLNTLFGNPNPIPQGKGFLTDLLNALVGRMIIPGEQMRSLEGVILVIIALVTLKNVFLWLGGQFGATLQERITRDLRDAVFTHMQRLPLNWFSRNKTGQVMARILTDTEQAKAICKDRASTVECVNAQARNRGLRPFVVRGLSKVKAVALWFAVAHDVACGVRLRAERLAVAM